MLTWTLTIVTLLSVNQVAQVPSEPTVQKLFEAGQYAGLLERVAATEAPGPEAIYLAGHAARRLTPPDQEQARNWFARLGGEETDYWTFVGRSANATPGEAAPAPVAPRGSVKPWTTQRWATVACSGSIRYAA